MQRRARGQIQRGSAGALALVAEAVEVLEVARQLRLARVVGREGRGVLGDAVADLEGEVRGRRADELRELALRGDVVNVLRDGHARRLSAAPAGGLR
jgi:hypothetical protein